MIGGPQILYNIFSQFPENSFSIVTSKTNIKNSTKGSVSGSWLPCRYYYYDQPFAEKKKTIAVDPSPKDIKHGATRHSATYALSKVPLLNNILIQPLSTLYYIWRIYKTTLATIKIEKPKVLVGLSDSGPALIGAYLASVKTQKKLVLYLFDLYRGNNLLGFEKFLSFIFEKRIFKRSSLIIVTNDGTEKYYSKKYNHKINIKIINNSTFTELYKSPSRPIPLSAPYQIVYTGNIGWPQEQSVINVINAVKKLYNIPLVFKIFSPLYPKTITQAIAGNKKIQISIASPSQMPAIQHAASLLVLSLSWNTKSPDIIATASPGKFTDYLASGRPMLIHAPSYAYVSQYARQHNLGIVVDQNNVDSLVKAIREFLKKPSIGNIFVENSLRIFHKEYDAKINAKKLAELLNMV